MLRPFRSRIPHVFTGYQHLRIKWARVVTFQDDMVCLRAAVAGSYPYSPKKLVHTQTQEEAMPKELRREILATRPRPMREELTQESTVTREMLEKCDIAPYKHREAKSMGDTFAYRLVRFLRLFPDTYFGKNHYMRVVMLETIAAVPGMVGAAVRHMRSLRSMESDGGWIVHLLHEAENERMHLMIFIKFLQPGLLNRLVMLTAQGIFLGAYTVFYLASPKTAHRFAGYLEEEAIQSYTHFLQDLDNGVVKDCPAPQMAIDYYNLEPHSTVRDVVLAVRMDEAVHRDTNHFLSDRVAIGKENLLDIAKETDNNADK